MDGSARTTWGRQRGFQRWRWTLRLRGGVFELTSRHGRSEFAGASLREIRITRRWAGMLLEVSGARRRLYGGLDGSRALELRDAIAAWNARHQGAGELERIRSWHESMTESVKRSFADGRWITTEQVRGFDQARPKGQPFKLLGARARDLILNTLTPTERKALDYLQVDLSKWIAQINEQIVQAELAARRDFLANVEASPLTEEQARAVLCFDNRVQVVAAAGSGKTSVMIARAAYALHRGFVPADRILLLAFNKAAAAELQERLEARLEAVGLPSASVRATTFHAFGLSIIAECTGRKPLVAPWVTNGDDVLTVSRIVDELRDSSPQFLYDWDLFRLLYARTVDELDGVEPEAWDPAARTVGYRTARNEFVKSQGERLIADWLFYNGVEYEYERPYEHDVADVKHAQYRPDFYYPAVGAWHEHWAIGRDGQAPKAFKGYKAAMKWKRELHRSRGTTLVESTWADIITPRGFPELASKLKGLGLELDWNPDRHVPGREPVKHEDLARLMRTFMTHVKSSSMTRESLEATVGRTTPVSSRTELFLRVYWPIHDAWQARLDAAGAVDFEDMLVRAGSLLANQGSSSRFDLVLVDEFQDASVARAKLTEALVEGRDKYLLAVGDDWQSINRFAGADLSVMTDFEARFGSAQRLRLETTFRSSQAICDATSQFVSKNARQIPKQVRSVRAERGELVTLIRVADEAGVTSAIHELLSSLDGELLARDRDGDSPKRVSVDILGRYRFDRKLVPRLDYSRLDVRFLTVHGAKGLEADYVILPNVSTGTYGFPSQIADDPVLNLVMTAPDDHPHAEERRLFYVALTRARHRAFLIAVRGKESPFVVEMLGDGLLQTTGQPGDVAPTPCPKCGRGLVTARNGRYGAFLGCTRFPQCAYTTSAPRAEVHEATPSWPSTETDRQPT